MDEMVADTNRKTSPLLFRLIPMSEQQRGRRALEAGPTGQAVAANLTRFRKRREMTSRQLSAALTRAGRPIPASGITRMERGERHVTVDELVALAAVLKTSPSALLLPLDDDPAHTIEITGAGKVGADIAWNWMDGVRPLRPTPGDLDEALDFDLNSRPPRRRRLWEAVQGLLPDAKEGGTHG